MKSCLGWIWDGVPAATSKTHCKSTSPSLPLRVKSGIGLTLAVVPSSIGGRSRRIADKRPSVTCGPEEVKLDGREALRIRY
jgi:hypothetical protein